MSFSTGPCSELTAKAITVVALMFCFLFVRGGRGKAWKPVSCNCQCLEVTTIDAAK